VTEVEESEESPVAPSPLKPKMYPKVAIRDFHTQKKKKNKTNL